MEINKWLDICVQRGASDLHINSGSYIFARIHGDLVPIGDHILDNEEAQRLIFSILHEKNKKLLISNWELDCGYSEKTIGRFRCNIFIQKRGIGAVFRLIANKIKTMKELNLPLEIYNVLSERQGLILVTGPTGSGKSTTLAALIHEFNQNKPRHIITIEDPIEFIHENQDGLVNQREVGGHTKSFANALKAALREDPDIILVGEMRDLETIKLAVTAAETGILILGTLHTNNASKAVDKMIQVFPPIQQEQIRVILSESLKFVIAQDLLKVRGSVGRVGVFEVLRNTSAIANLIRENKTFQILSTMETGASQGMFTFEKYIKKLIAKNKISPSEGRLFLNSEPFDVKKLA